MPDDCATRQLKGISRDNLYDATRDLDWVVASFQTKFDLQMGRSTFLHLFPKVADRLIYAKHITPPAKL